MLSVASPTPCRVAQRAHRTQLSHFVVVSTCSTYKQLCLKFAARAHEDAIVAGSEAEQAEASTASITRVLFSGVQPNQTLRNVLTKRPPIPRGPISAVLIVLSIISALYAAFRRFVVSRTKKCTSCRGYGVERCPLCDGAGSITWEGKWDHVEPCPRCMGRRFCNCGHCGGMYHHSLFQHISRNAGLQNAAAAQREDALEPLLD